MSKATKPSAKPAAKAKAAKPAAKSKPAVTTAAAGASHAAALFEQYWARPGDRELLRIYADALEQEGDPRGRFIQLGLLDAPTAEQQAAKAALEKSAGGALVGPARAYLREWRFGPDGRVARARTEADKLIDGIAAISRLDPQLVLTVTSLKTVALAQAFARISLGAIYFVDFNMITGSHGGTQLPDKIMKVIGPAFADVRNLALSCRGRADQCFSPEGLRAFGSHLKKLEHLTIDYYSDGLAPPAAYARVLVEEPGFASLRTVHFPEISGADMTGARWKLLTTEPAPQTPADLAALA